MDAYSTNIDRVYSLGTTITWTMDTITHPYFKEGQSYDL